MKNYHLIGQAVGAPPLCSWNFGACSARTISCLLPYPLDPSHSPARKKAHMSVILSGFYSAWTQEGHAAIGFCRYVVWGLLFSRKNCDRFQNSPSLASSASILALICLSMVILSILVCPQKSLDWASSSKPAFWAMKSRRKETRAPIPQVGSILTKLLPADHTTSAQLQFSDHLPPQ